MTEQSDQSDHGLKYPSTETAGNNVANGNRRMALNGSPTFCSDDDPQSYAVAVIIGLQAISGNLAIYSLRCDEDIL